MIRILNAEPLDYSPAARAVLQGLGEVTEKALDRSALLAEIPHYDVLIVRLAHQVDREVLDAGRRLRAVVSATTGRDHIDLDHAAARGIAVLTLTGETAFMDTITASAEHTWALLLALTRRIPGACAAVRAGEWERDHFRGHDLSDRRLGIVGLGRVGRKVAAYARAFGMTVAAHDPSPAAAAPDVARRESLDALLRESDVLSLHVPLDRSTTRMIGARELGLLPAGALLVNTARGEVVDEEALVAALEGGRLAGAAVDVLCHEREPERRAASPLLAYARRRDNLLVTPHIAGATWESMHRTELFMATKLRRFLERA
jgi:D-3-phosphoglycerate dehydrogenase